MVLILPVIFAITPVDGLCYRVTDSSFLQNFFLSCYEEKTVEIEKNEYCIMNMLFENIALLYSLLYDFHM